MTGFEIVLLLIGIVLMLGSFFVAERLSPRDVDHIAELSREEVKTIVDKQIQDSKARVEEMVDETIDNSMEIVEAALDKETNGKMLALGEYSDTVMEEANKTHNEIMFLYSMLNDKHTELTNFAGELQDLMRQMQRMESSMRKDLEQPEPSMTIENLQEFPQMQIQSEEEKGNGEASQTEQNLNETILELHNRGMANVQIAKELNIGLGEVQLVIGLYRGEGKA
ncbi:MAG: DUF6115 domain-containing protein [Lachnospiraceae bacterium]